MDYELGQFGNDPRTREVCERALKLHHTVHSGPVPYATLLAIAAMCSCPLPEQPIKGAVLTEPKLRPELISADKDPTHPANVKPKKNGRVQS